MKLLSITLKTAFVFLILPVWVSMDTSALPADGRDAYLRAQKDQEKGTPFFVCTAKNAKEVGQDQLPLPKVMSTCAWNYKKNDVNTPALTENPNFTTAFYDTHCGGVEKRLEDLKERQKNKDLKNPAVRKLLSLIGKVEQVSKICKEIAKAKSEPTKK